MTSLQDHLVLVKAEIDRLRMQIGKFSSDGRDSNPGIEAGIIRQAEKFEALLDYLSNIGKGQSSDSVPTGAIGFRIGDTSDLPAELLSELKVGTDELEGHILDCLGYLGGAATADELLVAMYRRHDVMQTRALLLGKLYRMAKHDILVRGDKRGVYEIPVDDEEATEENLVEYESPLDDDKEVFPDPADE